ncbi:hypothetical protein BC937DRAFT_87086 [Endogone sp. FLAS-F59071]|nr:hypothetical protein BC937DRAFT_87086 [Endogone sp. FLAS-F59071]|eukprot:RUS19692.1 hypothetical protein BC937DRAFT_87086 [Endogone sp. FLAS-F59071]
MRENRHAGRARIKLESLCSVMIITKPHDNRLIKFIRKLATWFITTPSPGDYDRALTVYVDSKLEKVKRFKYHTFAQLSPFIRDNLKLWTLQMCYESPDLFDFIVTNVVPPVLPFHLGSLGFLTTFDFSDYKYHIAKVLQEGVLINLRMCFTCTVYRYKRNDSCVRRVVARHWRDLDSGFRHQTC